MSMENFREFSLNHYFNVEDFFTYAYVAACRSSIKLLL